MTIEVWTDGSVKPEDSIGLAAKLIKDHMSIFINFEEDADDFSYPKWSARRFATQRPVGSFRGRTGTLGSFLQLFKECRYSYHPRSGAAPEREMLATKKFGKKSLNEIKDILNGMGWTSGWSLTSRVTDSGSGGRDTADAADFEAEEEQ